MNLRKSAAKRTDASAGDIPPEVAGRNYLVYRPVRRQPTVAALAPKVTIVKFGRYTADDPSGAAAAEVT